MQLRLLFITSALILAGCGGAPQDDQNLTQEPYFWWSTPELEATAPFEPPANEAAIAFDLSDIEAGLANLSFNEFITQSTNQILLRNPETITEIGIADQLGVPKYLLNDLSAAYLSDTQALESLILKLLQTYDTEQLTYEQQITYDGYLWHLQDLVDGHRFPYHIYPVHHFIRGYHFDLEHFFTQLHTIDNIEDANDYIARLYFVDDQIAQLIESLEIAESQGIVPPKFILEVTRSGMLAYMRSRTAGPGSSQAENLTVYTTFADKLNHIQGLAPSVEKELLAQAHSAIENSFIPGYTDLLNYVDYLIGIATSDAGAWKLPDGDEFYAYILRKETSTDLTPQEIHDLGLLEVDRVRSEMNDIFASLGYDLEEDFGDLLNQATQDAGFYDTSTRMGAATYVAEVQYMIAAADEATDSLFDIRPDGNVIVVRGPVGGYYQRSSADGSRPAAYHVGIGGQIPKYITPSIAYHEAIPGHHFQIGIEQSIELPDYRSDTVFNAYIEGWALYAERLAWEMGLYDDDPYGDLGRLQLELLRAVRLVTDTGLHALRWTREEAQDYIAATMGDKGWVAEVDRYITLPGQATGYKIGMLKILELRQLAMDQLGDQFDFKVFHNVVLSSGSMPLSVLERVVNDYIDAELAGP